MLLAQSNVKTAEEEFPGVKMTNGMEQCFYMSCYVPTLRCPTENEIRECRKAHVVDLITGVMTSIFGTQCFMVIANLGLTESCFMAVTSNMVVTRNRKFGLEGCRYSQKEAQASK